MATEPRRVIELDGLRGIAVLAVIVFHGATGRALLTQHGADQALLSMAGAGWMGVDLFFVLSGFLITGILLDTVDAPGYFRSFYARRTLRIFPLYYAALVLILLILPRLFHADHPEHIASGQGWYWTYLVNWYIALVGRFHLPPLSGHFWSLAVEEQFYLVWPLLVLLIRRRGILWLSVAMVIAGPLARTFLVNADLELASTVMRFDALAAGALLACLLRQPGWDQIGMRRHARVLGAVSVLGVLIVAATSRTFMGIDPLMNVWGYLFISTAGVSAVALASSLPWLRWPWLRHIGDRSYALYVLHPVALAAVAKAGVAARIPLIGGSGILRQVVFWILGVAVSLVAAEVSWHLWEKHWLRLKRFVPRPSKPQPVERPVLEAVA